MFSRFIIKIFRIVFKLTEMIAPPLAGRWAIRLFFTPEKPRRPRQEQAFLQNANRQKVLFRSNFKLDDSDDYYIRYSWGDGPAVLLVHGWGGNAAQMAPLAKPLLDAGYRVIAFDAPAHGDSPGKRTNMLEIAQVVEDIALHMGDFYAIVGHSLGGAVAGYAISQGVRAQKLVTIGSPISVGLIFAEFARQINAAPETVSRLSRFVESFGEKKSEDLSLLHLAPRLRSQGLIIHDKDDREIHYTQALELFREWPGSELLLTEGLGHRRILKDRQVISEVMNFVNLGYKEVLMSSSAS